MAARNKINLAFTLQALFMLAIVIGNYFYPDRVSLGLAIIFGFLSLKAYVDEKLDGKP